MRSDLALGTAFPIVHLEDGCRGRTRMVLALHCTLLQGFLGASMLLRQALKETPADTPSGAALSRSRLLVRRAIDESCAAIRRLQVTSPARSNLECAFAGFLDEVKPGRGVQLRPVQDLRDL